MAPMKRTNDQAVQETNDMSILSKASMSNCGYFHDQYLKLFASKVVQRAPLIHRGYYIRAKAIDYSLRKFIELFQSCDKIQIVSLGAGFDSSYFRLKNAGMLRNCTYVEIDFPDVVKRKQNIINKHQSLLNLIGDFKVIDNCLVSAEYKIIPCDLTNFQELERFFSELNIDVEIPTFVFSEVVLAYINYDSAKELLCWIKSKFNSSIVLVYEQIQPCDAFGQVMVKHFKKIQSPLKRVHELCTVSKHIELFQSLNYNVVVGFNLNFFFDRYLDIGEKVDMFVLEPFDEYEEWNLKCSHYCMAAAFQGACNNMCDTMFPHKQKLVNNVPPEVPKFQISTYNLDLQTLLRYGHACTKLDRNHYLVSGGFGVAPNALHDKLNCGFVIKFPDEVVKITNDSLITIQAVNIGFKHMYHTLTYVNDNVIFLFGGRASPKHPCTTYGLYKYEESHILPDTIFTNHTNSQSQPISRWRHAAVKFKDKIYIYGGRAVMEPGLSDLWSFNLETKTWKMEKVSRMLEACFSHTLNVWNDSLLSYGGLAPHLEALNSLKILTVTDDVLDVNEPRFRVPLPKRYCHTSHIVKDQLIVIGGIDPKCEGQPPILIISLQEKTWRAVDLPLCDPVRPLMLHNHCSVLRNNSEVIAIGGGGNCFSFGTHFNQDLSVLDISDHMN